MMDAAFSISPLFIKREGLKNCDYLEGFTQKKDIFWVSSLKQFYYSYKYKRTLTKINRDHHQIKSV